MRKSLFIYIILTAFLFNLLDFIPSAHADDFRLPIPGAMIRLSSPFIPAQLQGITVHLNNPLRFDFLIYKGDQKGQGNRNSEEYKELVKYFLASLTIPDEDQWVNLSPYEKGRIIKDDFGKTEMGRDLLAEDYLLKQITSSLIYPENGLGKKFWNKIYAKAWQEYHTTNVPVNTFNKVWIVPDRAIIYESGNTAYILQSHLRVMLEEDYLSLARHSAIARTSSYETQQVQTQMHALGSQVLREIILPELEREVNAGKNFAKLRQIFSGLILATWYKKVLKESLLGKIYVNKSKVKGVDQDGKNIEKIYKRYLMAFKKGVFNYIKEDVDKYTKEVIPRKYFSGGWQGFELPAKEVTSPTDFKLRGRELIVDKATLSLVPRSVREGFHLGAPSSYNIAVVDLVTTSANGHHDVSAAMTSDKVWQLEKVFLPGITGAQRAATDKAADIFLNGFLKPLSGETVITVLSTIVNRPITADMLTGRISISYHAEGRHKNVFKIEFEGHPKPLQILLAFKTAITDRDITEEEIAILKGISPLTVHLPKFGIMREYGGVVFMLEEFIEGQTFREVYDQGIVGKLNTARTVSVDAFLKVAREIRDNYDDENPFIQDINGGNVIINNLSGKIPRSIVIDVGEHRTPLKHSLLRLVKFYGYHEVTEASLNQFIFQSYLDNFGDFDGLHYLIQNLIEIRKGEIADRKRGQKKVDNPGHPSEKISEEAIDATLVVLEKFISEHIEALRKRDMLPQVKQAQEMLAELLGDGNVLPTLLTLSTEDSVGRDVHTFVPRWMSMVQSAHKGDGMAPSDKRDFWRGAIKEEWQGRGTVDWAMSSQEHTYVNRIADMIAALKEKYSDDQDKVEILDRNGQQIKSYLLAPDWFMFNRLFPLDGDLYRDLMKGWYQLLQERLQISGLSTSEALENPLDKFGLSELVYRKLEREKIFTLGMLLGAYFGGVLDGIASLDNKEREVIKERIKSSLTVVDEQKQVKLEGSNGFKVYLDQGDAAMSSTVHKRLNKPQDHLGGIDLNAANLNLQIKRDDKGMISPLSQQNLAQLNNIQGFTPNIIEIKSLSILPILNELSQKLQDLKK